MAGIAGDGQAGVQRCLKAEGRIRKRRIFADPGAPKMTVVISDSAFISAGEA